MAQTFPFEVHTPSRLFYDAQVEEVIVTIPDGEFAVMADHAACIAPVVTGFLRIKDRDGVWKTAFTANGILEVKEHKTVLMSEAAEWGSEIDMDRARNARDKAEGILNSARLKFETENAALSLRKAEYRLKVRELENQEPR
ncbi:MAG: ATP synthase F1 subunit epsilon [Treponema sp.]|nr:ATP synthase F1 subunit epsilon [Treponema sp.]